MSVLIFFKRCIKFTAPFRLVLLKRLSITNGWKKCIYHLLRIVRVRHPKITVALPDAQNKYQTLKLTTMVRTPTLESDIYQPRRHTAQAVNALYPRLNLAPIGGEINLKN